MTDTYYDDLAGYYRLMYANWEVSVHRQARMLDEVIQKYGQPKTASLLDVACGIGTQCIGLAELGYSLTASDLSLPEVKLAEKEALKRGLQIHFHVADMRQVWQTYQKEFDVVMALDNSIPHLLSDEEILQALTGFYRCTRPGGLCLISVRDYAQIEKTPIKINPRTIHSTPEGQIVLCDVWRFDGPCYEMTTYVIEDTGRKKAETHVIRGGKYYCVELPTLERLLKQAGFRSVVVDTESFFQPLLIATK